jgi:peptidoglycan-N-acetylglucosamine deacetylase
VARKLVALAFLIFSGPLLSQATAGETCPDPDKALGVSRVIEIDTQAGPLFGEFSKYEKEPRFLGPKEVVLTFDDGPMPKYTKPILDALDKYCTKATFFYVGQMAMAYPDMVKEVMGRGHTMGTHTWSHPMNLRRRGIASAKGQIERGFAAVALAAGQPIAPFFRFPGLSDSPQMLAYLQERGIGAFTVDVVSNDSYISSPSRLITRTLAQIERQNGGIVLFHDIKASTAKALPTILAELKKRGYKVVHLRSKSTFEPLPDFTAALEAKYAKKIGGNGKSDDAKKELKPFYAAIMPATIGAEGAEVEPDVVEIAPEPRERLAPGSAQAAAATTTPEASATKSEPPRKRATRKGSATRKSKKKSSRTSQPTTSLGAAVTGVF